MEASSPSALPQSQDPSTIHSIRVYKEKEGLNQKLAVHAVPPPSLPATSVTNPDIIPHFGRIAIVVELMLASSDILTPIERLCLQDYMATVIAFVYHFLPVLLPWAKMNLVSGIYNTAENAQQYAKNVWDQFRTHVAIYKSEYPTLRDVLTKIRERHKRWRNMKQRFRRSGIYSDSNIYIHRFIRRPEKDWFVPLLSTQTHSGRRKREGKKVVIDCKPEQQSWFPSRNYHHLSGDSVYTIRPQSGRVQIHLMVIQEGSAVPPDNDKIREMFKDHTLDYHRGGWYIGSVVYNLFTLDSGREVKDRLYRLSDMAKANVNARKPLKRGWGATSENRKEDGYMFGSGSRVIPGIEVNLEWSNFDKSVKAEKRFEIFDKANECSDYLVLEALFPSLVDEWRRTTLRNAAFPTGDFAVSTSIFFTQSYCPKIHIDNGDQGLTAAIRLERSNIEHPTAFNFFYPCLAPESDAGKRGVVIEQHSGTVWLFDASRFEHGTTVPVDRVTCDKSVGFVILQKSGMMTFVQNRANEEQRTSADASLNYYSERPTRMPYSQRKGN